MPIRQTSRVALVIVSLLLASIIDVPATRAAAGPITGFSIDGPMPSPLTGGVTRAYRSSDSTFAAAEPSFSSTPGYVLLHIEGKVGTAAEGHWWYVHLAAAPGDALAVGTYANATRAAFRASGVPGIDIYGDGVGCNEVAGSFTVHEISFAFDVLERFAATYAFTCDGNPITYQGEVRYQSTVGFRAITLTPQRRAFATRTLGTVSSTVTTVVTNRGTEPLSVAGVTLGGADPTDFQLVSQTCTAASPLASGTSCSIAYAYAPASAAGDHAATITVTDDTTRGSHDIPLTGTATTPIATLSIENSVIDFGTIELGALSANQTTTVTSTGTIPLDVAAVSLGGAQAADFSIVSQTCTTAPIAVGASCTVTTRFAPKAAGTRAAVVTLDDNTTVGSNDLSLSGVGKIPVSDVAWGTVTTAGPAYTWNGGNDLAVSSTSAGTWIESLYTTDRVGGTWVDDNGPYKGVYAIRSKDGVTWSTGKRLNPTTQHGDRVSMAASGASVYASWVSETKYLAYSPTAPRVLYFRANTKQGASDGWSATIRLTSTTGRVDFPVLAASGATVLATWTDSVSGSIVVRRSTNRGVTWGAATSLGTSTLKDADGFWADPSIAISGSRVIAAWRSGSGVARARLSTDGGATWGPSVQLASTATSTVGTAALGDRVATTWAEGRTVRVKTWKAGVAGATRTATVLPDASYQYAFAPTVALRGTSSVAVAITGLQVGSQTTSQLLWVESADGALWFDRQAVGASTTSTRRSNVWPSVVWAASGSRYVLWNGWTTNTTNYRMYLRKGTGTP